MPKHDTLMRHARAALGVGPAPGEDASSCGCVSGTSSSRRVTTTAAAQSESKPATAKATRGSADATTARATSGPSTYPRATVTAYRLVTKALWWASARDRRMVSLATQTPTEKAPSATRAAAMAW